MRVIATAGHVDHGKSTLVRALTGMEPDRWAEERGRGLTIGLGFVWTTLPGVGEVAFVDVPGHERFVRTMLAGIGSVPAVLFVVAADGGWMPQSEEHLAALDALGVAHGLLVVTRADLADPTVTLAEARARIARTSLGDVEAVAVSARTGEGMPRLHAAITRLAGRIGEGDGAADVRLWIDRVFTVAGAGTVVTGTLAGGTLRVDDELALSRDQSRVHVRGLQSLGRDTSGAVAVARVAVNLRGRTPVARGDALLTPDAWQGAGEIDVALRADDPLPRELVLHIGSAAVAVHVRPLGTGAARLRLSVPLPLRVGDRALLRDPGRHRIAGRADVLDVQPPELPRRSSARERAAELAELAQSGPTRRADAVLRRHRFLVVPTFRRMGLPVVGAEIGRLRADPDVWLAARDRAPSVVATWSAAHPLADGMPLDVLRQALDLPDLDVTQRLVAITRLSLVAGMVRAGTAPELPARVADAVAELARGWASAPFVAPEAGRLARLGLGRRELAAAARAGRLTRVAEGVVLVPGAPARAARLLATLAQPFTVSQARRCLGTTRRVAVPLLELLDRHGVTERFPDDTRRLV